MASRKLTLALLIFTIMFLLMTTRNATTGKFCCMKAPKTEEGNHQPGTTNAPGPRGPTFSGAIRRYPTAAEFAESYQRRTNSAPGHLGCIANSVPPKENHSDDETDYQSADQSTCSEGGDSSEPNNLVRAKFSKSKSTSKSKITKANPGRTKLSKSKYQSDSETEYFSEDQADISEESDSFETTYPETNYSSQSSTSKHNKTEDFSGDETSSLRLSSALYNPVKAKLLQPNSFLKSRSQKEKAFLKKPSRFMSENETTNLTMKTHDPNAQSKSNKEEKPKTSRKAPDFR